MNLESLRKNRQEWVETNRRNRFEAGIKNLLSQLYPDNAHFIYELLQNAEDTGASEVRFKLTNNSLEFRHNGRLFSFRDVESITGIGDSTKRNDPTSIGKFGVGFKAVFAYTNTPQIHSGEFHFCITNLVVPETEGVKSYRLKEHETLFLFPFDHAKKTSKQARIEIEQGLNDLSDNTLLFLSHISKIEYTLPDGSVGSLERIGRKDGQIEIHISRPGSTSISNWLRFEQNVEVVDEDSESKICRIAIAYHLVEDEDKKKGRKAWKVSPLDHGQVSIYFPAEKETSNLRFHLHAPFASTVARDSVRECPANHRIRDYLATLIVNSLTSIRDQGMLTVSFFASLPVPADNLQPFYEPIREAIVAAFQNEPLTPTRDGAHAKAASLYRGPARISEVLNDEDLSLLTNYTPPLWAANPSLQNQREDQFLDSLQIDEWGWIELARAISYLDKQRRENIEDWIAGKDDAWLMRLYALFGEACDNHYQNIYTDGLRIVRVGDDKDADHVVPAGAFFRPDGETKSAHDVRFVKQTVYNAGRSEAQKKYALSFLQRIGVRSFNAKTVVELRLARYEAPPKQVDDEYFKDLKQFIAYWKQNPAGSTLFQSHTFLLGTSETGLHWLKSTQLCLDKPYLETGLTELAKIHNKEAIWDGYYNKFTGGQREDLIAFLKSIEVMYNLKPTIVSVNHNPSKELLKDYYRKWTDTSIREDYSILNLDNYIAAKSISASRLIWNALIHADPKCAKASFRPNQQYELRTDDSQLVYHLKTQAWVPDNKGVFHKPQDMTKSALRADFPYNEENGLLNAIGFGEKARQRSEEYLELNHHAQKIGFVSADQAAKYAELAKLAAENGKSIDELVAQLKSVINKQKPSFPERAVVNPDRRQQRLSEQMKDASNKEYEQRPRSVRTTRGTIDPYLWLRKLYTNDEDQMICQICQEEMPFKKRDGEYYFEAVEAFSRDFLVKEHEAQYLALCPLCAAMYQEFIKRDEGSMNALKKQIMSSQEAEVPLQLGEVKTTIRFVEKHWRDIKTILQ